MDWCDRPSPPMLICASPTPILTARAPRCGRHGRLGCRRRRSRARWGSTTPPRNRARRATCRRRITTSPRRRAGISTCSAGCDPPRLRRTRMPRRRPPSSTGCASPWSPTRCWPMSTCADRPAPSRPRARSRRHRTGRSRSCANSSALAKCRRWRCRRSRPLPLPLARSSRRSRRSGRTRCIGSQRCRGAPGGSAGLSLRLHRRTPAAHRRAGRRWDRAAAPAP